MYCKEKKGGGREGGEMKENREVKMKEQGKTLRTNFLLKEGQRKFGREEERLRRVGIVDDPEMNKGKGNEEVV